MCELRKRRENQDSDLIQVLDGIQWDSKAAAIEAGEADPEYKVCMMYTVQRCCGDMPKHFFGLRYLLHAVLPTFFMVEQHAAHFLSPKNMQASSFTRLQHAVSNCSEIWDLRFAGLDVFGFQICISHKHLSSPFMATLMREMTMDQRSAWQLLNSSKPSSPIPAHLVARIAQTVAEASSDGQAGCLATDHAKG